MRHKQQTTVEGLQKFVDSLYAKYPAQTSTIEAFLQAYKLPDGRLQNDDDLMHGLNELKKKQKWTAKKAAATRQSKR
jgi:hypothetical protein